MGELAMIGAMAGGSMMNTATQGAFNLGGIALQGKLNKEMLEKAYALDQGNWNDRFNTVINVGKSAGVPIAALLGSPIRQVSDIGGQNYVMRGPGYQGVQYMGTTTQNTYGYGSLLDSFRNNGVANPGPRAGLGTYSNVPPPLSYNFRSGGTQTPQRMPR